MLLIAVGCSSVTTSEPPPVLYRGPIAYEGNKEYLPRTIEAAAFDVSGVAIRYSYDVKQGVIASGINGVRATATLDLISEQKVKRSYQATRSIRENTWFGRTETLTILRRRALIDVRNEIEEQMQKDYAGEKFP